MIGAMFGGILVANLVYTIVITALAKRLKKDFKSKCLPNKAIQIVKDMRAVNEVKKMFTCRCTPKQCRKQSTQQ